MIRKGSRGLLATEGEVTAISAASAVIRRPSGALQRYFKRNAEGGNTDG